MQQELFEQYETAKNAGNKRLASKLIARFIETFRSDAEREQWTRWYIANRAIEHRVRHELFEHIMFPVLLTGFQQSDPWCIEVLERCVQNLYKAEHLWSQIDYQTAMQLAERSLELAPNNPIPRLRVLNHLLDWFQHCEHEWPAGILYGMDGASESDCESILDRVQKARTFDCDQQYSQYLDDFESKVKQYATRLAHTAAKTPTANL